MRPVVTRHHYAHPMRLSTSDGCPEEPPKAEPDRIRSRLEAGGGLPDRQRIRDDGAGSSEASRGVRAPSSTRMNGMSARAPRPELTLPSMLSSLIDIDDPPTWRAPTDTLARDDGLPALTTRPPAAQGRLVVSAPGT